MPRDPERPDAFDEIAESLSDVRAAAEAEQLGEAREIVAAELAGRGFVDELRRISPGDVVTVVGADREPVRGRILAVGADWVRVGEIADASGTPRARVLRVHDLPLRAVVRVIRGPGA